jgi:transposase-like protein
MLSTQMDCTKLQELTNELAKDIKTEADLNALSRELLKLTVETALCLELTEHLGYEKHSDSRPAKGNARNGTTSKRLKSQHGDVEFETPRDRVILPFLTEVRGRAIRPLPAAVLV